MEAPYHSLCAICLGFQSREPVCNIYMPGLSLTAGSTITQAWQVTMLPELTSAGNSTSGVKDDHQQSYTHCR